MKHCLIFSRETFYVTIVFCLNILWLKAVNEITARQTWTTLCKHDVIKVSSIEYLITQIELVLSTFFQLLDRSQKIEYLTLGLLYSLWNIYHSTTAYFLTHHVYRQHKCLTCKIFDWSKDDFAFKCTRVCAANSRLETKFKCLLLHLKFHIPLCTFLH